MAPPKKRLGDILLEMGVVDALQLRSALGHHQQWGMPLGQTLVERRICSVEQVLAALARQTGLPVVRLDTHPLERAPIRLVPRHLAERHRMIPLSLEGSRNECLVVAAAAPVALDDLDAVCAASGKSRIRALLAADDALDRAIARLYGPAEGESEEARHHVPIHGLPSTGDAGAAFGPPVPVGETLLSDEALAPAGEATFSFGTPSPEAGTVIPFDPDVNSGAPPPGAPFDGPGPEVTSGAPSNGDPFEELQEPGRVLLYGWSPEVTGALGAALSGSGIRAEAVDEAGVLGAAADDVVISSTLALEALLGPGQRLAPRIIICGTPDRSDMGPAKALGARVYLPPPFSVVQLGVAVQRCHEAAARRRRRRFR